MDDLSDPDSKIVTDALTRRCDGCGARRGELCWNHVAPGGGRPPLSGRLVHYARTVDRSR